MLPRFLAESIDPAAARARLSSDETRHLSQVLRLAPGSEVIVFDGAGREFRARIERAARDGADVLLLDEIAAAPEPSVRLTLAQAVLKGDKMDDVVRDATMMGAVAIDPLVTDHTVAHVRPGHAPERWRRIAIASAKQCGRAVVPAIGAGATLQEWLTADRGALRLLLAEPSASVAASPLASLRDARPPSASLLVGPEGGWSAEEIDHAVRAGCTPVTLGRRTLRADAVAIVAIGALQFLWGDL
jgi:16S rRNA (uracil1498-N3)-methyltransferase